MTAVIGIAAMCLIVLSPWLLLILGWTMDEKQRQTKLPTKGIDDEA